jgi:hypothetical protein
VAATRAWERAAARGRAAIRSADSEAWGAEARGLEGREAEVAGMRAAEAGLAGARAGMGRGRIAKSKVI